MKSKATIPTLTGGETRATARADGGGSGDEGEGDGGDGDGDGGDDDGDGGEGGTQDVSSSSSLMRARCVKSHARAMRTFSHET